MTKFKDFGTGSSSNEEKEKISFRIHGEEFECHPEMPGKLLLDLVKKSASEDPTESAGVIDAFFKTVLVAESYARFDALSTDPTRIVTVETLGEITGWLVEQYTSRPTARPEVLPSGQ